VENCRMSSPDLDRGIRIKTNAMRGGGVNNLNVRNLDIGKLGDLIVINFYYEEGENGPFTPSVSDIDIRDIECRSAGRVMDLRGFDHARIRDVRLTNINVQSVAGASRISNVEGLVFDNVHVNGKPVLSVDDLLAES
jgi:hypothetical protein